MKAAALPGMAKSAALVLACVWWALVCAQCQGEHLDVRCGGDALRARSRPDPFADPIASAGFTKKEGKAAMVQPGRVCAGNCKFNDVSSRSVTFWIGPAAIGDGDGGNGTRIEVASWSPRAFVLHNFLSEAECDHMVEVAKPKVERATVQHIDPKTGARSSVVGEHRTSWGVFLKRRQDAIQRELEERTAILTGVPPSRFEDVQVLRYEKGQQYKPHTDFFEESALRSFDGGQRVSTMLMYLSHVHEGGETHFPIASPDPAYAQAHGDEVPSLSACGKGHVSVLPKKRNALFFYSVDAPFLKTDDMSEHEGCPVVTGEKWSATIWMVGPRTRTRTRTCTRTGAPTRLRRALDRSSGRTRNALGPQALALLSFLGTWIRAARNALLRRADCRVRRAPVPLLPFACLIIGPLSSTLCPLPFSLVPIDQHARGFRVDPELRRTDMVTQLIFKGGSCEDRNDNCASWAESGECARNPSYMLENCGASCNASCKCQPNDVLCERQAKKALEAMIKGAT